MKICEECGKDIKLRKSSGAKWAVTCECPDLLSFTPKERATIIVPSRYPDIFEKCRASIDKYAPLENKILVRDGHDITNPTNWKTIQAEGKFVYSRNINLGIKQSTGDVLLTNDDVLFTHPNTLEIMQSIMARHPEVGILSPRILGPVGEYWQGHCEKTLALTDVRLCFVCVLIRRSIIDELGMMDEEIGVDGYGWDDADFCRRVVNAGYKLGVTGRARVIHGHVDGQWSSSFRRENLTLDQLDKVAGKQFFQKWGDNELACLSS